MEAELLLPVAYPPEEEVLRTPQQEEALRTPPPVEDQEGLPSVVHLREKGSLQLLRREVEGRRIDFVGSYVAVLVEEVGGVLRSPDRRS